MISRSITQEDMTFTNDYVETKETKIHSSKIDRIEKIIQQ